MNGNDATTKLTSRAGCVMAEIPVQAPVQVVQPLRPELVDLVETRQLVARSWKYAFKVGVAIGPIGSGLLAITSLGGEGIAALAAMLLLLSFLGGFIWTLANMGDESSITTFFIYLAGAMVGSISVLLIIRVVIAIAALSAFL